MRAGGAEAGTGRVRKLGPFAVDLGLSALGRLSPVACAEPFLEDLRQTIRQTVALAVWGAQGPVIVSWLDWKRRWRPTLRVGSIMPLTRSATGLDFVDSPERITDALVKDGVGAE